MAEKLRIGILTGGGDCAGLNPAIKWATKGLLDHEAAKAYGKSFEVVGILNGWAGITHCDANKGFTETEYFKPLNEERVRTWDRLGGTNLGSSRTNPFKSEELAKKCVSNIQKLGIEALIAIGGEDTLGVAEKLGARGVNVVGIPKTIDKDLCGTDYSLGFATSVEVIKEEIGRLRTTAGSHGRLFVVETMGRHAGHLSLQGGIAGGACMILIPEVDFDLDKVYEILRHRKESGARYDIVVVAEGAKPTHKHELVKGKELDDFGHEALGGIGDFIAKHIKEEKIADVRAVVLSHLQRGGEPCAYDIRIGRAFGLAAAELVMKGSYGNMISLRDNRIIAIPISEAIRRDDNGNTILNLVDVAAEYDTQKYIAKRKSLYSKFI